MNEVDYRKAMMQQPMIEHDVERAKAALLAKLELTPGGNMTGCTSYLQRKLQIGYNTAASILEELERRGIISECDNRGARRLLK
jgi:DNA segregation ATPase FtsK/SpoIIIE-like protein